MREIAKRKITLPENKRILAVSDIHGHRAWLEKLLKKVRFTSDDVLFIVGDIVEKGPESLNTLRYVMELCENYTVYPSIGNVDSIRLKMLEEDWDAGSVFDYVLHMKRHWGGCFFTEMCAELELPLNTVQEVSAARMTVRSHFKRELDFLRELPTFIETQDFIFVHGGLPAADTDRLSGYSEQELLKNNAFMEKGLHFDKYVVVGHWPVMLYSDKIPQMNPIVDEEKRIISMDGGCGIKKEGQLNMLLMNSSSPDEIRFESYDDLQTVCAKTAQEESVDSIYIKWTDNKIEVLERQNGSALVRHRTSGRKLNMPECFLYDKDGDTYCSDYTDYRLKVKEGDKLSLILKTPTEYYVKKDGVIGWYSGEAETSENTEANAIWAENPLAFLPDA